MEINIGKIRNDKGLSTRDLEKRTGIAKSRIGDIENPKQGKRPVDIVELEAIAIALKVRISDLYESKHK